MSLREKLRGVRRRTWVIAGAGVVVLAGVAVYVLGFVLPGDGGAQAAANTTSTATASLETLEQTVEASGTLTPGVQEDVSFLGSGTVQEVLVTEGQEVAVGDALATIDTLQVQAALLQAQATLASAEAELSDAQSAADGTTSSDAQIASARASVTVAEESVAAAQEAADGVTLVAPVAGLVTSVGIEAGDSVTGSSSTSSSSASSTGGAGAGTAVATTVSTAAFTITGTDSWTVETTLSETDVAAVEAGDQVELATSDGVSAFGTVAEVGLLPSTTSGSVAYPVTISVTGTEDGLYDGISVTATIITERRTDVLTVLSSAITTSEDGTTTVTLVAEDGTETETVVETGETSGTLTEIVSGLAEGDAVLVTVFTPGSGNSGTTEGTTGGTFPGGELPSGGEMPMGGGFGGQAPGGAE